MSITPIRRSISAASGVLGSPSVSTTATFAPASLRRRAATNPSPPLLPRPQKIVTYRPSTSAARRIAAAAALPAFSIRRSQLIE